MKGIIDEKGYLTVVIDDRVINKFCPHNPRNRCGVWCTLFSEVYTFEEFPDIPCIDVCEGRKLRFTEGLEVLC